MIKNSKSKLQKSIRLFREVIKKESQWLINCEAIETAKLEHAPNGFIHNWVKQQKRILHGKRLGSKEPFDKLVPKGISTPTARK